MNAIQMILVVAVAFLAGTEGILDEWQFHQPLVACTLIGLVTGHLDLGVRQILVPLLHQMPL